MGFHTQDFLTGAVVYGGIAYALRTIPNVNNPWARWIIGIAQFLFANVDKGKQQLNSTEPIQIPIKPEN